MAELEWLDGGITAVPGIHAGGVAAGIKSGGKKDLALIYSPAPARVAAVFTANQVKGAPVVVSAEHARGGTAQAILASSGCSNVCTGERGIRDAREMARLAAELLRIPATHVLVASTGVIGVQRRMDGRRAALPTLVKSLSPRGGRAAAEAILTTDTRTKEAALRLELGGRPVTIGGIAKGVGMLEPHLATMFCFVAPHAGGGRARRPPRAAPPPPPPPRPRPGGGGGRGLRQFATGLEAVMGRLARMLVSDGEGATKLVAITVRGAASHRGALAAARSVANSPLVKTAINGQDPHWGRIMMALGKSAARVDQDRVAIAFDDERLVERGMLREGARLDRLREIMALPEYAITIDLGLGRGEERVLTCDLSEEYVRINGKYPT